MTKRNNVLQFPIFFTKAEEEEESNSLLTNARVAIFYKGLNTNGSNITREFAENLISTIDYCPIKGSYNILTEDFNSHSNTDVEKSMEKIYGVVPKEHNFAWEEIEGEDGVVRTYACVDAYIWTGIHSEANKIIGSSQSMEIYQPTVKGEWKVINGKKIFEFTEGEFLGLQVLGKTIEPCFEDSVFFSLLKQGTELNDKEEDNDKILKVINYFSLQMEEKMKNQFRLSAEDKTKAILKHFNQEDKWRYNVVTLYDNYAVVIDYEEDKFMKVPYSITGDEDVVVEAATDAGYETLYADFLTKEEKTNLDDAVIAYAKKKKEDEEKAKKEDETVEDKEVDKKDSEDKQDPKKEDGTDSKKEDSTDSKDKEDPKSEDKGTEDKKDDKEDEKKKKKNFELENSELMEKNATLELEVQELKNKNEELTTFKLEVERKEKEEIINNYAKSLPEDVIEEVNKNIDTYSVVELDKELAYRFVKSTGNKFFSQENTEFNFNLLKKDDDTNSGSELEAVLRAAKEKRESNY